MAALRELIHHRSELEIQSAYFSTLAKVRVSFPTTQAHLEAAIPQSNDIVELVALNFSYRLLGCQVEVGAV